MKVIITGAAGKLGRALLRRLPEDAEITAVDRSDGLKSQATGRPGQARPVEWLRLDLTDAEAAWREISHRNPEVVFHCAALNDVDECELHPQKAYRENALATRNVAAACQRFDALLVHYSTNFVFDGRAREPYREDAPVSPVNRYGWSKARAEGFVAALLSRYFIVRTSWLFGEGTPNIISRMLEEIRKKQEVFCAQEKACPTYAEDLAEASLRLAGTHRYGIYHLTNAGPTSRRDLAREVAARAGRRGWLPASRGPVRIRGLRCGSGTRWAARPKNGALENFQWEAEGFSPLRPWREALSDYMERLAGGR